MSAQGKYHKSSLILTDKLISNEKRAVYLGWSLVTIGFGDFLLWSALAPLDKGVPVSGNVIVAGNHKTIQHQYGGIIEQLSVNNGEKVRAGQILLTLNTVEVHEEYNIKLKQYHELLVREARLLAEQLGKKRLIYSPALQGEMKKHDISELIQLNQQLLENQYQVLQLELASIKEKITGLNATLYSTYFKMHPPTQQKTRIVSPFLGLAVHLEVYWVYAQQQKAKSQKTQLTMLLQQLEGLRELYSINFKMHGNTEKGAYYSCLLAG